jgi:hypothetical protein
LRQRGIRTRAPSTLSGGPGPLRRLAITTVALCVAAAGLGFGYAAFRDNGPSVRALPSVAAPSGMPSAVLPGPGLPFQAGSSLLAIDGAAGDDIWAVGETHGDQRSKYHSLVEHWDGVSWRSFEAPDVGRVVEIDVNTATDIWALGDRALLHFNGVVWTTLEYPNGGRSVSSMSSTGPDDVWLAGEQPGPMIGRNSQGWSSLVMHWDGSSWSQADTPNPGSRDNYLQGIEALSPNDVWAAGYVDDQHGPDGLVLTMHWDGRSWSEVPSPNPSANLNVIWGMGSAGSSVWALGHFQSGGHLHALILRWDGARWVQVRPEGSSLWSATSASGTSEADVWIAGSEPTSSLAVAHCGGPYCAVVLGPELDGRSTGTSVYSASADDVWVVGYRTGAEGTAPLLRHWDSTRWVDVPSPLQGS